MLNVPLDHARCSAWLTSMSLAGRLHRGEQRLAVVNRAPVGRSTANDVVESVESPSNASAATVFPRFGSFTHILWKFRKRQSKCWISGPDDAVLVVQNCT
jgi:hypothetical protein